MRNFDRTRACSAGAAWRLSLSAVAAFILLGSGCSSSDSEVRPGSGGAGGPGSGGQLGSGGSLGTGSGGSLGSGSGGSSTGGTPGTGGSAGGAPGTGGSAGGAPGTGGSAGGCTSRSKFTQAAHETLTVTWPAGTATLGGTGTVHLWGKIAFTASGTSLTGSMQACGTVLPPAELSALVGGGMLLIEFPPAAWDAPSAPHFDISGGTLAGWNVGDTFTYTYTALVGFTMADGTTAPWPASYTGITMPTDFEGDTIPGLTTLPRASGGYVLPPTSIAGAIGLGSRADKVYITDRNVATVTHKWTSCDEGAGTEEFKYFNNHVIGCHVMGAADCTAAEIKFVDDNRTIFSVTSASTKTKIVPDTATCADVRNALPM
jgi:hypothetical protein